MINRTADIAYLDKKSKKIITYWALKIIIDLNGSHEFFNIDELSGEGIAYLLGLDEYVYNYRKEDKQKIIRVLKAQLMQLKKENTFDLPKILKRNIGKITKLLMLNQVEKDILIFTIYLKYIDIMDNITSLLNSINSEGLVRVLSVLLSHKASKVKKALSPQEKLSQSGLITVNREISHFMNRQLELLSYDFADRMINIDSDIEDMIRDSVRKCVDSTLTLGDFGHLKGDLNILVPYLKHALNKKQKGVNILFYGKPGTGKTELTKALAKALEASIYEVTYADANDDVISGDRRLSAYKVAQSFFADSRAILMFDEIEDIVDNKESFSPFAPSKQNHKGWINRILENNNIPTIWITNDIYSMDPAMIRRYDMSIEIPIPPKEKRKEIILQDCGEILSKKSIEKIAKNEMIAPALVTRAAKVLNSIADLDIDKDKAFEKIVNNTLKAQGYPKIQNKTEEALPESYDPRYINADTNLKMLAKGIKAHPNARICLYGVPGTGKSAFGKWIAKYTDKPFLLKKGSDLISMFIGGTEQNIANAFREAKEEDAVLVFDEVDSFLQDRRNAKNSWEVTQVNEMLVQMENFDGIFIATTNLMQGLDQASLRRFDMKLEFKYLSPKQAWRLFVEECRLFGINIENEQHIKKEVEALEQLAPGDFAAVRRQHKFRPIVNAEDFWQRLLEELSVKENNNSIRTMGFVVP